MSMLLFTMKKVISAAILPLGASLLMLIAGFSYLLIRPGSRLARSLCLMGIVVLTVSSLPCTGRFLIGLLESEAGGYADPRRLAAQGVRDVVVLGGGAASGELTPADQAEPSLARALEGVRLWRGIPGARLILSGGAVGSEIGSGEAMARAVSELGVPETAVLVESESLDTESEAALLAPHLGARSFALVTSAFHMPRSLEIFRRHGLDPIPAPCDFRGRSPSFGIFSLLPGAQALDRTQTAVKEYIGRIWSRLKYWFVNNAAHPIRETSRSLTRPQSRDCSLTRSHKVIQCSIIVTTSSVPQSEIRLQEAIVTDWYQFVWVGSGKAYSRLTDIFGTREPTTV